MKTLIWAAALVFGVIVQSTWLPMLAIYGVKPDLLLLAVASTGLLFGKEAGVGIGFFAGLLQDLLSGNIFGLNILAKMTVGYAFGLAERNVFKENILLPVIAAAMASVLNSLVIILYLYILGYDNNPLGMAVNGILPIIAYNMVAAIPVHMIIYKCNKRIEAYIR